MRRIIMGFVLLMGVQSLAINLNVCTKEGHRFELNSEENSVHIGNEIFKIVYQRPVSKPELNGLGLPPTGKDLTSGYLYHTIVDGSPFEYNVLIIESTDGTKHAFASMGRELAKFRELYMYIGSSSFCSIK